MIGSPLAAMHACAVHLADQLRFAADVKGIRRFHLHPECQFKGLNARFKPGIGLPRLLVLFIELVQ